MTDPTRRALAHPVRLRMMALTRMTPMSGAELARELGIPHALAARHLRRLADAGLVAPMGEGRYRVSGGPSSTEGEGWVSADDWDDFRYRLAALLVTLHDAARAPRPVPEPERVGARVMSFPSGR
jgi:DNA-binding transcriptional ArsR family regulator